MHASLKIMAVGVLVFISLTMMVLTTDAPDDIAREVKQHNGSVTVFVDGTRVVAEVADTQKERVRGLSGRSGLPYGHGMLLVFDTPGYYSIWMKGMRFPLDIYWLQDNGTIVDMWENAQPESYPSVYTPANEALYILEVPAGFSEAFNISRGDTVTGLPRK